MKPPFDPLWGAWILLLAMVLSLTVNGAFLFVGCAVFGVQTFCDRTSGNLRDVSLEMITAIALLVSQKRS